jgi:hypothetical protein
MPPKKRALAVADPNALTSVAKRNGKGKAKAPDPPTKKPAEKAKAPKKNGKTDNGAAKTSKGADASGEKVCVAMHLDIAINLYHMKEKKLDWSFVTICPPREGDEDEDEENEVDLDDSSEVPHPHGDNCVCNKPLSANPSHGYCLTKAGMKEFNDIRLEADVRDQDNFGEHFYTDYTGYGYTEVMENNFTSLNKEFTKNGDITLLWAKIEGLGMWLNGDLQPWFSKSSISRHKMESCTSIEPELTSHLRVSDRR